VKPPLDVGLRSTGIERRQQGLNIRPQNVEAGSVLGTLWTLVAIAFDDVARAFDPGALFFLGDLLLHLPIGEPCCITGAKIFYGLDALAGGADVDHE
jgi:hypothetical protein